MKNILLSLLLGFTFLFSFGVEKAYSAELKAEPFSIEKYRDEEFILNFSTNWCPKCQMEKKNLIKWQNGAKKKVVIVYVNVRSSKEEVVSYLKDLDLKNDIYFDENKKLQKEYKLTKVPTSFLIGKDGKIIKEFESEITEADLK